jgi:hypothetical protein
MMWLLLGVGLAVVIGGILVTRYDRTAAIVRRMPDPPSPTAIPDWSALLGDDMPKDWRPVRRTFANQEYLNHIRNGS